MVSSKKTGLGQQRAEKKGAAFKVYYLYIFFTVKAEAGRGDFHDGREPLPAVRVAKHRVVRVLRPEMFRRGAVGVVYMDLNAVLLC